MGSVYPRGKKFVAKIPHPEKPGKQMWLGTHDTEADAWAAVEEARAQILPASRVQTVSEWCDVWLRDYERPAPATQRTYRLMLKRVRADIGHLPLTKVDRPTARRWAREWPNSTTRVARALFGDAHRDGLVAANPFEKQRLEQPKGRKDIDALGEDEIFELADAALDCLGSYGTEFRALIIFLGFVGCRPGELACIRRADVDLTRAEVTIRYALDGDGGEKRPKNGKPRVVTLPPPAIEAVRSVPVRVGSPYLFHTARGERLNKGSFSYAFRVVRQRWGKRDKLALYELRHACATLLMERGLPPHVVANQLGHTDGGALVQRLYGHPREVGMREQVRMAFADWSPWQAGMEDVKRRMEAG